MSKRVENVKGKKTEIERVDKLMQGIKRQVVDGKRRAVSETANGQTKADRIDHLKHSALRRPGLTAPPGHLHIPTHFIFHGHGS
jgi:hypothetical protein